MDFLELICILYVIHTAMVDHPSKMKDVAAFVLKQCTYEQSFSEAQETSTLLFYRRRKSEALVLSHNSIPSIIRLAMNIN